MHNGKGRSKTKSSEKEIERGEKKKCKWKERISIRCKNSHTCCMLDAKPRRLHVRCRAAHTLRGVSERKKRKRGQRKI